MAAFRTFGLPLALFALCLGVYLSNARFLESTDTVGNELLPISLLQHASLTFDQYYALPQPDGSYAGGAEAVAAGSVADAFAYRVAPDAPTASLPWWFTRVGGHVVSLYPIAPGLANTPVFVIADWLGVDLESNVSGLSHITTALIAALSVLAMYLCLVQFCAERRTAVFLTIAFAFGTAVWSANSRSLYQHGLAALLIAGALACLILARRRLIALAGLLLGLMVVTRPTDAVIAAGLAWYVVHYHRRSLPAFLGLGALPVALLIAYSWVVWGTPLALGQGQGLSGFTAAEPVVALAGLLVSPNRGLLVFSPIFLFSFAYAVHLVRRRSGHPLLHYVIWSSLALIGVYSLWGAWFGGHTYGYRFLIELVPGLMLLLGAAWPRLIEPRPVLRGLFLAALLASIYVHGLGAYVAPCGFDDSPDNIDVDHARLWDVANGEIARCTASEAADWQAHMTALAAPSAS